MKRSYEHPQHFVLEIYDQALGELIPDAIQHLFLARELDWEPFTTLRDADSPRVVRQRWASSSYLSESSGQYYGMPQLETLDVYWIEQSSGPELIAGGFLVLKMTTSAQNAYHPASTLLSNVQLTSLRPFPRPKPHHDPYRTLVLHSTPPVPANQLRANAPD